MNASEEQFDIIIAGGGTSGCVIAGRLAAADHTLKILVLEAGPPTLDDPAHVQPARYLSHIRPGSTTLKFYTANKSEQLDGRSPIVSCGQCLGGGSSVNFTIYNRAAASDYDDWRDIYRNVGWGADDLIPFFKKCETYQVDEGKEHHGYEGPLKVSYGGIFTNLGQEFLDVAARYDPGRSRTDDPNTIFGMPNSYARWPKWIDKETGRRSDVAHHYIYNQKQNENLCVKTGCQVKRVIFERNRAVGVEYYNNPKFNPNAVRDPIVVLARRMVVVSSGSIGSPSILERSGIGAQVILTKVNVPQRVDLPGVGENYQDHQVVFVPYLASENAQSLDGIVRDNQTEIDKWSGQWALGTGLLAHNGHDAAIKLRPTEEELKIIGPDFSQVWADYYANAPDKPVLHFGSMGMYVGDPSLVPARNYLSHVIYLEYPAGAGHIHITSGEDVDAPLDFETDFLSHRGDLALFRWGYKRSREFARRTRSYEGEYLPEHPKFSSGSEAVCTEHASPLPINTPNIRWTTDDDAAIDLCIRQQVKSGWHGLGTCAMKPRDKGGVVDPCLNVYGVDNLKVADMSIAPSNVSANTYSTAIMIGEKAAAIIAKELGITSGV